MDLIATIRHLQAEIARNDEALRRYAAREDWDAVYAECRDEYKSAWDGQYESHPWKFAAEALRKKQETF